MELVRLDQLVCVVDLVGPEELVPYFWVTLACRCNNGLYLFFLIIFVTQKTAEIFALCSIYFLFLRMFSKFL